MFFVYQLTALFWRFVDECLQKVFFQMSSLHTACAKFVDSQCVILKCGNRISNARSTCLSNENCVTYMYVSFSFVLIRNRENFLTPTKNQLFVLWFKHFKVVQTISVKRFFSVSQLHGVNGTQYITNKWIVIRTQISFYSSCHNHKYSLSSKSWRKL